MSPEGGWLREGGPAHSLVAEAAILGGGCWVFCEAVSLAVYFSLLVRTFFLNYNY